MATTKTRRTMTAFFKRSRARRGRYLDVRFLPGGSREQAVLVASSVSRLAVVRNRTRRVIAAVLRDASYPEGQLVVVAKKSLVTPAESQAARDELHGLLHQLP